MHRRKLDGVHGLAEVVEPPAITAEYLHEEVPVALDGLVQ